MRALIFIFALLMVFSLSACNLGRDGDNQDDIEDIATSTPLVAGKPTVTIISPSNNDEFLVNEPVLINVTATDAVGVTSVQLMANEQVVRTVASESAAGNPNMSVLLDFTPRSPGNVALRVVAFRGRTESDPATVNIVVRNNQNQITSTVQQSGPIIDANAPNCQALVNTGLNLRRGPATTFDVIRVLGAGEVVPVVGRLPDSSWLQLSSGTNIGWVDASFVTPYGRTCVSTPIVSPATSTPAATATSSVPTSTPIPATATSAAAPTNTPVAQLPNLVITSFTGPDRVTIPDSATSVNATYSVTITNQGGAVNSQFSNSIRFIPGGEDVDMGVVANLAAGQSINLSVVLTFDTKGDFILRSTTDSENQVAESNEADNTVFKDIKVQ